MKKVTLVCTLLFFVVTAHAQHSELLRQNNALTLKLLEQLIVAHPGIQLLHIEGKVYADKTFKEFAKQHNIPFLIVVDCGTEEQFSEKKVEALVLEISSNPYRASVTRCKAKFDCRTGEVQTFTGTGEDWRYDSATDLFVPDTKK